MVVAVVKIAFRIDGLSAPVFLFGKRSPAKRICIIIIQTSAPLSYLVVFVRAQIRDAIRISECAVCSVFLN